MSARERFPHPYKECFVLLSKTWDLCMFFFTIELQVKLKHSYGKMSDNELGHCFHRDWLPYAIALLLAFMAVFMMVTRLFNQGGTPVDEVKVVAPPAMNAMEQLLAVQNTISQVEQLIQDGNIVLLKLRALLLAIFPQV